MKKRNYNMLLRFPHKEIRAKEIKKYMRQAGYSRAVCFSCGNAARKLEEVGVNVLHIGAHGKLEPTTWFRQSEIANDFHGFFDATSGNLPVELMRDIGEAYRQYLGEELPQRVYVPTGSGETIVCLKMAYPNRDFVAVYNLDEATKWESSAPLNALVNVIASEIIYADAPEEESGADEGMFE